MGARHDQPTGSSVVVQLERHVAHVLFTLGRMAGKALAEPRVEFADQGVDIVLVAWEALPSVWTRLLMAVVHEVHRVVDAEVENRDVRVRECRIDQALGPLHFGEVGTDRLSAKLAAGVAQLVSFEGGRQHTVAP